MSGFALRPMLPGDGPALAALFRASIEELAQDDYTESQREAWISRADDEGVFAKRLLEALTLIATAAGTLAGFATLSTAKIDMLYVAPDHARRGAAGVLIDALERLAAARKIATLTVEASDTARDVFAARGYIPQSRNTVPIGEEWLGNTTMTKTLSPGGGS